MLPGRTIRMVLAAWLVLVAAVVVAAQEQPAVEPDAPPPDAAETEDEAPPLDLEDDVADEETIVGPPLPPPIMGPPAPEPIMGPPAPPPIAGPAFPEDIAVERAEALRREAERREQERIEAERAAAQAAEEARLEAEHQAALEAEQKRKEQEAAEAAARKGNASDVFNTAADDVVSLLNYNRFRREGIFEDEIFSDIQREVQKLNRVLDRAARLRIGGAVTALYQVADKSRNEREGAVVDVDFFGRWRPIQNRKTLGYLIFQFEGRYRLGTDIVPQDLGDQIGSLWGTVNGYSEKDFELKSIYWQQYLFQNTFVYRIGKIDQGVVFNTNRLQSDNLYFLNQAFSDNPTLPFPSNGLGADIIWRPKRWMYLAAGAADASPSQNDADGAKLLDNADWSTIAEVGFTPWLGDLGGGSYRFTGWYTNADDADDVDNSAGFAMSIDQDIGPQITGFLRYGVGDGRLTTTKEIIAGGFGWKRPWGNSDDYAGIAFAYGRPSNDQLRNQSVLEAFYRFQLSPATQITPDIQVIFDPTLNPAEDMIVVFGIRFRASF